MTRVLVILGAAVWPDGKPSPTLLRRTRAAAFLWHSGAFDLIIPSGGVGKNSPSEASVMAGILKQSGVPDDAILLEDKAATTMETARFVSEMLANLPDSAVTLVTDRSHVMRSRLAFWSLGVPTKGYAASATEPRPKLKTAAKQWAREGLALPYYLFKALMHRLHG